LLLRLFRRGERGLRFGGRLFGGGRLVLIHGSSFRVGRF
jgi:hypothetical protein